MDEDCRLGGLITYGYLLLSADDVMDMSGSKRLDNLFDTIEAELNIPNKKEAKLVELVRD